jgi:uncharacterized protein
VLPREFKVVLGSGDVDAFATNRYFYFFKQLQKSFLEFQDSFDVNAPPDECNPGSYSRWRSIAESILEGRDDLVRVANMRKIQRRRLIKAGVSTMSDLAATNLKLIPKMADETFQQLKKQAHLQIETKANGKTAFDFLDVVPGRGLTLLPDASRNDVFFDMEGYPLVKGGLEYLFGASFYEKDEFQFRDWWGHDREQEKAAFEGFIDWVYHRWLADPSMHIYHYASYEVTACRRLASAHGTRIDELDNLLRQEVFVDLYCVVRQALAVGEPSYSIKYIEHLYRGKREGDVVTAGESVVAYEKWIDSPDGNDWRTSEILKGIRDYNKVDCDSTAELTDWLRERRNEKGIAFTGKVADLSKIEREPSELARLSKRLLDGAESIEDETQRAMQKLLAWLIEFHNREEKPKWWRFFDQIAMTEEELFEDLDCLGCITRTAKPPVIPPRKNSKHIHEFKFDPAQDTKLDEDDTVRFIPGETEHTIASVDRANGLVNIKVKPEVALPNRGNLIPCERFNDEVLEQSIYRTASAWERGALIPQALYHVLSRSEPNIRGRSPGEPVSGSSEVGDVVDAVKRMDRTCLCIQGPPGCGKTFTASRVILELLRSGKRVGVTSNSHKAIENLLLEVAKAAGASNFNFRGAKVGPKKSDEMEVAGFKNFASGGDFFKRDNDVYDLVGGTAWLFSREEAVEQFDYLFVDEAGQVCLANLTAVAPSAQNLVLLGDQMQLEQPVQGFHPEGSGISCLQHMLQGHATVPPSFGLLLDVTHRMHPSICKVISESVYDGRLSCADDIVRQSLAVPKTLEERFGKSDGIVWLPVEHSGNTQGSEEEADAISELVKELLLCQFTDKRGSTRKLSLEDILIVAPYNMQVRLIADRVKGARVGSVDKFQGLGAPVVILSMCASEGNVSARGLEFLFSENRLNVAISRAMQLAFVVGNPSLVNTPCTTLEQMGLLNFFCRLVEAARTDGAVQAGTNRLILY